MEDGREEWRLEDGWKQYNLQLPGNSSSSLPPFSQALMKGRKASKASELKHFFYFFLI
jgi:hypothetical protein